METYQAIKNMSDGMLIESYKELKYDKLPKYSLVRGLQYELSQEAGKTVALSSAQYQVAMEMVERFCKIEND